MTATAQQFLPDTELLDASFRPAEAMHYGLAVVGGTTGLSMVLLDFRRNRIIGICGVSRPATHETGTPEDPAEAFTGALEAAVQSFPWMTNPFRLVKTAWAGWKSTLVPEALFERDAADRYLRFTHTVGPGETILCRHLVPIGAWDVFAVPESIPNLVAGRFPRSRLVNLSGLLVESIWINYKNRINAPHLFLHLRDGVADVVLFDGRELGFVNAFRVANQEETAYYLLFVMEQTGLNPEQTPVVLLGDTGNREEVEELLRRYVRHLARGARNPSYSYSYALDRLPEQAYFPLLNFFSCAL